MKGLDLFCGAGGCSVGYQRAGIEMIGVDNKDQPRYPFQFIKADALDYLRNADLTEFDFIHASPPCQGYSKTWFVQQREHPMLVKLTRKLLRDTGKPYIIENVPEAPLRNPITLCGSSFNLPLKRHRAFESNVFLTGLPCREDELPIRYRIWRTRGWVDTRFVYVYGNQEIGQTMDDWREAMGIDWMLRKEMSQAIPPAYTEFLGRQIVEHFLARAA